MDLEGVAPELADELVKLDTACSKVAQAIADAVSVREVMAIDDVEVPPQLQEIAYAKVPSLGSLRRLRDTKIEEIVKNQLSSIEREYSDLVASREFDRVKVADWSALRASYPELYAKALREGKLILDRKQNRKR